MSAHLRLRSMHRAPRITAVLLGLTLLAAAGCGADNVFALDPTPPVEPNPSPPSLDLNGSWRALYWIAETSAGTVFDVITEGGSLVLQLTGSAVSGSMHVPENVTNGAPQTVSMDGTVRVQGDSVRFEQTHDTFVQRAAWVHHLGDVFDSLVLVHYPVEGTRFTVVLVRNW